MAVGELADLPTSYTDTDAHWEKQKNSLKGDLFFWDGREAADRLQYRIMEMLPSIAGLLIALGGPPLVAFYGAHGASRPESLATNLLCQAALLGLLMAIMLIVLVWEGAPLSSLGLRPVDLTTFAWAAGIASLFVFLLGPIILRLPEWLGRPGFEKPLAGLQKLPVWYLLLAVFVGGSVEELLYRGFAIERLAHIIGSDWLAAVAVIALFGLGHVPLWGWTPALTMMIPGAILTIFYLWHRDIAANILAHVTTDFVGIVLPVLLARTRDPASR